MWAAMIVLGLLFFWFRPLEKWEGTLTSRANETKVPREIVLALDLASLPLMIVVMFGLPSSVVLAPPNAVADALGFKDIVTELIFWAFSGAFAYVIISVARILISTAWYFFGFGAIRLYSMGGWKSLLVYIILPFVVLGPVTKATNVMLTASMGGLLSMVEGEINYSPILLFLTLFNVAMVVNGIMKAPSQGQYMLTYFAGMFEAITATHINAVYKNADKGRLMELPILKALGDDYEEVPISDARRILTDAGGKGVRGLGRFMYRHKETGEYALHPDANDVVNPGPDGKVHFK